jgi:hypothetical protein
MSENSELGKMLNFFANCWIHLYRFKSSYKYISTPNSVALLGAPKLLKEIEFSDEQFEILWSILIGKSSFLSQLEANDGDT